MHGDGGIDQIASQRSEAGKCPLLVGPGKLAESDHIRRKKAASFRVSAMAVPSPHARLARLLIGLYRLWVQHLIQHLLGVGISPACRLAGAFHAFPTLVERPAIASCSHVLAVEFVERDPPSGIVTLIFSGGGAIRLEVECLEAELVDLGEVFSALLCPDHFAADTTTA